jgi:protein-disulfide isomerase
MLPAMRLRTLALALSATSLLACSSSSSDLGAGTFAAASDRVAVTVGDSPALGPADAKVTLVEFGDFQCPYCGDEEPVMRQLRTAYDGRVRFVFKQFPLSFHEYAQLASEAALAANAQGQFWPYHDSLYDHQPDLARADLETYAEGLGLDMTKFGAALDAHTFADAVAADFAEGEALGVPGTPAFFINGRLGAGAMSYQSLAGVIDEELAK